MSHLAKRAILAAAGVVCAGVVGLFGIAGAGASSTPSSTQARATTTTTETIPPTTLPATQTLKFIAVTTNMSNPTKSGGYYEADVDVRSATKSSPSGTIAQDVLSCTASSSKASCNVALADAKGILEGSFTVKFSTGKISGKVTGGTGTYSGTRGTITGSPSAAGEAVTVTYSPST
jgi:hypothetical protein